MFDVKGADDLGRGVVIGDDDRFNVTVGKGNVNIFCVRMETGFFKNDRQIGSFFGNFAIDSADVVLMKSKLSDLAAAIRLSRATLLNIKENLFWAFVYNTIGIPLAAGLFVSLGLTLAPMFGAAAMSLSSFCVVTNALRLNFAKIYGKSKPILISEEKTMEKIIKVEGMMCPHCEAHVKKALEALEGVEVAVASHEKKTVTLTLSQDVADLEIKNVITSEGYKVIE